MLSGGCFSESCIVTDSHSLPTGGDVTAEEVEGEDLTGASAAE